MVVINKGPLDTASFSVWWALGGQALIILRTPVPYEFFEIRHSLDSYCILLPGF